ncbi:MAG: long-chain-fatty-acid--CoA ligase [Chloroflexota bacterium]
MLVGDILRTTGLRYPDKVGIVFEGRDYYTWAEMNNRANALANGLLAMGLNKQDRVAMLCRNCPEYLVFYFACAKAGLIAVPLNTWCKERELSFLINDSGARALIVDEQFLDIINQTDTKCVEYFIGFGGKHPYPHDFSRLMTEPPATETEVTISEDDLFALSYTSGTTGRPKGCMITHRNSVSAVTHMAMEMRVLPHSVYLLHAPMFFAAGGGGRFPSILRGSRTVLIQYDATAFLQAIERERVTHFSGSPTPMKRLVDHPDVDKFDLRSVRVIGLTGAPHSLAEIKGIERVFGHVWQSCWGMSETCACGSMLHPEEVDLNGPTARRAASIGLAQSGLEIKVVDESGKEVPHDSKTPGEVTIKGDIVTKGYWNQPEATAEALKDGWLYSGDLGTVDKDGYIYIVDRKKDIIKSGGILISAREVEEVIYTHPAVASCCVIGVPDPEWGETPKAVVVLNKGMKATGNDIIELCRKNLASYKKPSSVDFVDSLPVNATGKIVKKDVKEWYWKGQEKRVA